MSAKTIEEQIRERRDQSFGPFSLADEDDCGYVVVNSIGSYIWAFCTVFDRCSTYSQAYGGVLHIACRPLISASNALRLVLDRHEAVTVANDAFPVRTFSGLFPVVVGDEVQLHWTDVAAFESLKLAVGCVCANAPALDDSASDDQKRALRIVLALMRPTHVMHPRGFVFPQVDGAQP